MNKKEFLNNYLVDRRNTSCVKWDSLKENYGRDDLIAMWIADTEFKIPKQAQQAMIEKINHGAFGYAKVEDEYYESFIKWMEEKHNTFIKKEWIRFSTGCITAMAWAINAFTKENDHCAIMTPVYYPFYSVVSNNKREITNIKLDYKDGHFSINYHLFEEKINEDNVKMLLLCSPHNPCGRIWTEEELNRIFEICDKYNVLIVSDEIHQDLELFDNKFIPALNVSNGKYKDRIITISSASKTFNMASLLHSHIIISNDKIRNTFDIYAGGINRTEANAMGLIATKAAYDYGSDWLKNLKEVIEDNYLYIKNELEGLNKNIKVCNLEATYLLFIDFSKVLKEDKIKDFFINKCKIAPDFGEIFASGYNQFIRLNLATDPFLIKMATENIKSNLKQLK